MDALTIIKQLWPYLTGFAVAGFAWVRFQDQRAKDKLKHLADIAEAEDKAAKRHAELSNEATRLASEIANETMRYQQGELKEARAALARNLEMELKLRRDLDRHQHEIEALERVNDELRRRVDFLEAEIRRQAETFQIETKQQADRYTARITQLEGELRQQKQVIESARRVGH